jgi:F420-dependent oxidoreductase-like protein
MITHPVRSRIPIWVAALGEHNVRMAAEVADGWLPMIFIPEKVKEVWGRSLAEGNAKRDPTLGPLKIAGGGLLAVGDGEEIVKLRDRDRPTLALYIGGMGARGRNFYNDLARRYGYEKEATEIQDLYLSGKREEAAAAIPEEILELTSLVGPAGWVAERVAAMREAGVTHLQVTPVPTGEQTAVSLIEELKEIIG